MTNEEKIKSMLKEMEQDYISYGNLHDDGEQGIRIIEDALRKQVPMKPIQKKTLAWISDTFKCPVCGKNLTNGYGCAVCLQAIDWGQIDFTDLKDIAVLELSVRSYNCLKRAGINSVHELKECIDSGKLMRVRNLGKRSYDEITQKLEGLMNERTDT